MKKSFVDNAKLITIASVVFVVIMGIKSNAWSLGDTIASEIASNNPKVNIIENDFVRSIYNRPAYLEVNSRFRSILGIQDYYADKGVYVTSDGYTVGVYPETTTDYEYEQMTALKQYLDDNGVNLIYFNEPIKYADDSEMVREFSRESYINRNTDKFLSRIAEAGITYVDLRNELVKDGYSPKDLFYRTDHHWTVNSGKWAAEKMAGSLNEYCGYDIDMNIFDDSRYEFKEWKSCWLGEQGKVVGEAYVGLDDYTCIRPAFDTDYLIIDNKTGTATGATFNDFIDESVYDTEMNVYDCPRWHYSYDVKHCINNNVANGKVLLLGDSYDVVTVPFLSLAVNEIDYLVMREFKDDFDLRKYIVDNGYDTVLICYAQFMIGAHDDQNSANYKMFDFD